MPNAPEDTARSAGRGGLAILGAKVYFMLIGLVQQIALKAVLGLPGYGAYSTAQSIASITYNPIVQTSVQGVSREVAGQDPEGQGPVLRSLLIVHALGSIVLGGIFWLLARPVTQALGAPHVGRALAILSVVIVVYGIYAPLIGALNGLRRFLPQAALDVAAATLRTLGLLGGAALGMRFKDAPLTLGVEGANAGFACASLLILLVALGLAGTGRRGSSSFQLRTYARFALPVLGGQLLLNLLFQADALVLRRLAASAAASAGLGEAAADPVVGAYRAAQLFCFLPYQLLMSVTFILFPLLASAKAQGQDETVREYVRAGVRLAALLAAGMVSVLVALPGGLIGLVYGQDAAELGASAMRPLAIGLGGFALLGVMTSAMNGLGRPGLSLRVTGVATALILILTFGLAHDCALGPELPFRVGLATALSLLAATLYTAVLLKLTAGAVMSGLSLARILAAGAIASLFTSFLVTGGSGHASRLGTLVGSAFCSLSFLGLLVLMRELDGRDWAQIRAVLGRRSRSGP